MVTAREDHVGDGALDGVAGVATLEQLAGMLRKLRRRHGRARGDTPLTYRELSAKTGWAHGIIGDYFSGKRLPPTDRFDILVRLLGASAAEQGALATARDRVEENRRRPRPDDPQAVIPRELPRDVTMFTGRGVQLAELDQALARTDTAMITVLSGTAGVGKTALAVRWAHVVADRFPDGCLYVDLCGFSDEAPMRPEQALSGFLRSLGCHAADIPPPGPEQAARYRSLLADRRMLVLLDNAHSAEQLRLLLPGTPSCFALVTSRDKLAGLVARDGAGRIVLDRLPPADANRLLEGLIGERAAVAPQAIAALAERCARLPLALRVAAELAVSRPGAVLSELVDELADTQRRLDLFDAGGDPATAVRGTFSWSYRHLADPAARTFRLLGLHPGHEFDVAAVAALTGSELPEAARAVGELNRAHLIEARRRGRHGTHDLLRAYAVELAAEESSGARDAATGRLLAHYLDTAAAAVRTLYRTEASGPAVPTVAEPAAALEWLDTERANLVAASGVGGPGFASRLSATLWRYLDAGGYASEALTIHGHDRRDAERRGDRAGQGAALGRLGHAYVRLARYPQAIDHMRQSLVVSRELGDPAGENAMLNGLAQAYGRLGRYREAIEYLNRALAIDRHLGNRPGEAKALGNLGIVHAQLGCYREARQHFAEGLRLARLVGDVNREGELLNNLGLVNCWLNAYDEAVSQLRQGLRVARDAGGRSVEGRLHANLGLAFTGLARVREATDSFACALAIHRELGDRAGEAETLTYTGDMHLHTGRPHAALEYHDRALLIADEIGERSVQAAALNGTGRALLALGQPDIARRRHLRARGVAAEIGDRMQQARALDGIAHSLDRIGRQPEAHRHWRRAVEIYTDLGVPDADEIRIRIHTPEDVV